MEYEKLAQADAVRALQDAGLLHDDDTTFSTMMEGSPLAVATRDGSDLSLAWKDGDEFATCYLDEHGTKLVRLALKRVATDRKLLCDVLTVLEEVASACDNDPRLRARVGGLDLLLGRVRRRIS